MQTIGNLWHSACNVFKNTLQRAERWAAAAAAVTKEQQAAAEAAQQAITANIYGRIRGTHVAIATSKAPFVCPDTRKNHLHIPTWSQWRIQLRRISSELQAAAAGPTANPHSVLRRNSN